MRTAADFTRWRIPFLLICVAGIATPLRAANLSGAAPTPTPSVTGSAAIPAASPAAHLPGNDPSLFASSIPLNSTLGGIPPAAESGASTSFAVNLLQRLVKRGILSQQDAEDLTKQAQADAVAARAQSQADAAAASQAVVTQVSEKVAEMAPPPPPSDDTVSVPYVPDNVKQEIAEEVKAKVMKQALAENWASPRAIPDWVPRFRFSGDIRTRYEGDFYPNSNDASGAFPNFNSINTGAPFDVAGTQFSPQYDVNQDRERFRIRARIAADIDLQDGWTAGIRLASGQDDSPVTENQTLGLANNGQGGNFSKYSVWLDRAFLRYEYQVNGDANKDFSVTVGRMDNPFFSTSMIWARDLGFDRDTPATPPAAVRSPPHWRSAPRMLLRRSYSSRTP